MELERHKKTIDSDEPMTFYTFSLNCYAFLRRKNAPAPASSATTRAVIHNPLLLLSEVFGTLSSVEGFDAVGTRRVNRKGEPVVRSFFAKLFYKLINKMSKIEMVDGARDYMLMTRQVAESLKSIREYNRYSKGLFNFIGYNVKWIEYENKERVAGTTTLLSTRLSPINSPITAGTALG